jgi:hypothetical protein
MFTASQPTTSAKHKTMNLPNSPTMQTAKTLVSTQPPFSGNPPKAAPNAKPAESKPRPAPAQTIPRAVRFEVDIPHARKVSVAGNFNAWDPADAPLVFIGSNKWFKDLYLVPGRYEYRFVVDGKWVDPPKAKAYVPNPYGSRNAEVEV